MTGTSRPSYVGTCRILANSIKLRLGDGEAELFLQMKFNLTPRLEGNNAERSVRAVVRKLVTQIIQRSAIRLAAERDMGVMTMEGIAVASPSRTSRLSA